MNTERTFNITVEYFDAQDFFRKGTHASGIPADEVDEVVRQFLFSCINRGGCPVKVEIELESHTHEV